MRLMAFRPLNSFFATADDLLSAELPRLGEALLVHLNSYEGQVKQHGKLYRGYLLGMLENQNQGLGQRPPGYDYQPKRLVIRRGFNYCPKIKCQREAAAARAKRYRDRKKSPEREHGRGLPYRGVYGGTTNDPLFSQ